MSVAVLAGNPNCGKTTLFNRLTGSRYKVGNRAGVTVEAREGIWNGNILVDLPGIYSLSDANAEERAAREYLCSGKADIIINVADASNPERGLRLTYELAALGIPMIIVLNMADLMEKSGFLIDKNKIEAITGVPVVAVSAAKGEGIRELKTVRAVYPCADGTRMRRISKEAIKKVGENKPLEKSIKADRLLLGGMFSGVVFVLIAAGIFWLTFGTPGQTVGVFSEKIFSFLCTEIRELLAKCNVNSFVTSLLCDGILMSIGGVVPFFGQILILFFCISVLEDTGYMSRMIFLSDYFFEKLSLDARAVVPFITSFGCTTSAAMTVKNISDKKMRKKTLGLLAFIPCSAKMPIFLIFAAAFFGEYKAAAVAGLYFTAVSAACVYACFSHGKTEEVFVLELPPYRVPTVSNTINRLRDKLADFVKRSGGVLFLAGIGVWLLQSFDFTLGFAASPEQSILGTVGKYAAVIFKPCGFDDPRAAVALISGIMAKEAVISTLSVACGGDFFGIFSPASAAAFLVFVLFYPPCIAALSAMSEELSPREITCLAVRQTVIAWCCSSVVFLLLK